MLSLDNAFTDEDVRDFVDRIRRFLRLPGRRRAARRSPPSRRSTACRCRCATRDGKLVTGATRGDGAEGEDVTANVTDASNDDPDSAQGQGCPDGARGARRGLHDQARISSRSTSGRRRPASQLYVNPRNTAAGSLRQLDAGDHGRAAAALLRLCLGRDERPCRRRRSPACSSALRRVRLHDQSADARLPRRSRSCSRTTSDIEAQRAHARLRHRRRRLQGRPARLAGAARLRRRARRAGRSRTNSRPSRRRPCSRTSTSRSAAPARSRRSRELEAGRRSAASSCRTRPCTTRTRSRPAQGRCARRDIRVGDTVIVQRAGDVIPQVLGVVLDKRPRDAKPYAFPDDVPVPADTPTWCARQPRPARRARAPLHRRVRLPVPDDRASEAFRLAPRLRHRRARREADRVLSSSRAGSRSRPTSSRCRRRNREIRLRRASRATAKPRCAICSPRSRRGARSRSTASSMRSASAMSARRRRWRWRAAMAAGRRFTTPA